MDYKTYSPAAELEPILKCLWTLEAPAESIPQRQRIIPDGCMEMIFHYGDPYRQYFNDGHFIVQPRAFVFGQLTDILEIEPVGTSGIIAARFLPEGLAPFLDRPVSALTDKAIPLEQLFGEKGKQIEDDVLKAPGNDSRRERIQSFLISMLSNPATIDAVVKSCVETIFQSQGQLNIGRVADTLALGRRSMERKFSAAVGLSPKQLSKLARLQHALKALKTADATLTAIAHESGYFDQAHFIRDFREFTGMSPKSFFGDSLRLSTLFIDNQ